MKWMRHVKSSPSEKPVRSARGTVGHHVSQKKLKERKCHGKRSKYERGTELWLYFDF
jgi:hypothetical protein